MTANTSRARRGVSRSEKSTDELSTVFPSVAPSAASARRFVAAALRRWGCPNDFIELVLLLTSELVTNAYRHAGTETRVSVRLDDDCTRVEVRDVGRGEPELRPLDTDGATTRTPVALPSGSSWFTGDSRWVVWPPWSPPALTRPRAMTFGSRSVTTQVRQPWPSRARSMWQPRRHFATSSTG